MAELNDEQALSYCETMANAVRAFKHLEDVVRYARNSNIETQRFREKVETESAESRKVIARAEEVAKTLPSLEAEMKKAQAAKQAFEQEMASSKATLENKQGAMLRELSDLESQRNALSAELNRLNAERDRVAEVKKLLEGEHAALVARVASMKTELERLKQRAAAL